VLRFDPDGVGGTPGLADAAIAGTDADIEQCGTFHGFDDIETGDLGGGLDEAEAAVDAPVGGDQAGTSERLENLADEGFGDLTGGGEV